MGELVTFGEALLRYAPPKGERLESARSLSIHTGGAESNVAVALARLGHESVWLSKLADTALGHRVERDIRGQGVETEVVWTDEGRQGVYYLEAGGKPRGTTVVYDREDAAVTTATVDELATEQIESADAFYTSGITPALSETLAETTSALLRMAREAGVKTVFDVNYRSKLWSPKQARNRLPGLLSSVNVLVIAEQDAASVFGYTGTAESIGRDLRETYRNDVVVVTRGDLGATAVTGDDVYDQPTFDTETHDPIGTGDAFVAGLLARWLTGAGIDTALEYGAATAALKRTIDGDMALVTPTEVESVIEGDNGISR